MIIAAIAVELFIILINYIRNVCDEAEKRGIRRDIAATVSWFDGQHAIKIGHIRQAKPRNEMRLYKLVDGLFA